MFGRFYTEASGDRVLARRDKLQPCKRRVYLHLPNVKCISSCITGILQTYVQTKLLSRIINIACVIHVVKKGDKCLIDVNKLLIKRNKDQLN